MITITLRNSAGELDRRDVETEADISEAVLEIARTCILQVGDSIVITSDEEDA